MQITPETKPISELFPAEGSLKHIIPAYQRNYSWKETNIETLFNDIQDEKSGYYMGNLLVQKHPDSQTYDIVDGQQRITTISLMFLAIYERLNELVDLPEYQDKASRKQIYKIISNIEDKLFPDHQPRLVLLKRDAEVYNNYLASAMGDEERGKFGTRAFAKRYAYIKDMLSDPETIKDFDDIKNFYDKLNAAELLRIAVNDAADAFSVFSSLNSKGVALTLIDLLKTEYLAVAMADYSDEAEAGRNWDRLTRIFTGVGDEPNTVAITQFLQNNFDAFEGQNKNSITKTAALGEYKKLLHDNGAKYMDTLIQHAKYFSYMSPLIDPYEGITLDPSIVTRLNDLKRLEATPSYPLLLILLDGVAKKRFQTDEVVSIIDELISFYVRRNIVLRPKSSNIRSRMIEIARKLKNATEQDDIVQIANDVIRTIGPSDEDFRNALDSGVYDVSPKTVRYILISVERAQGNYFHKQNPDTLDDTTDKASGRKLPIWSIEHILPETPKLNPKNGWPEMISPDNVGNATEIQQQYMHKIGNLTLTAYNAEMGDRSFQDKVTFTTPDGNQVGLQTPLALNSTIVAEGEDIQTKQSWTINDIERRTAWFKDVLTEMFSL